jgi:hypothetical protein
MTMSGERCECTCGGKTIEIAAIEACSPGEISDVAQRRFCACGHDALRARLR